MLSTSSPIPFMVLSTTTIAAVTTSITTMLIPVITFTAFCFRLASR